MGKARKAGKQPSEVKEPSEEKYLVRDIVAETDQFYLIDWEDDRVTGEQFKPTWEPKGNPNDEALDAWEVIVGEKAANQRAVDKKPMNEKSVDEIKALVPTAPVFYNGDHCKINPARHLANVIRQAQGYFLRDGHDAWSHTSRAMRERVLGQLGQCVDIAVNAPHSDLQDKIAQVQVIHDHLHQMNPPRKRNHSLFPGCIFDSPNANASTNAYTKSATLDSQLANPLSGVSAKDFLRDSPETSLWGKNILWILSIGGLTVMEVAQELHAAGKTTLDAAHIQEAVERELKTMRGDFAANLADFNDFRGIFRSSLGKDFAVKTNANGVSTIAEGDDRRKRAAPDDDLDAIQQGAKAGGRASTLRTRKERKGNDYAIATSQESKNREPHAGNST